MLRVRDYLYFALAICKPQSAHNCLINKQFLVMMKPGKKQKPGTN